MCLNLYIFFLGGEVLETVGHCLQKNYGRSKARHHILNLTCVEESGVLNTHKNFSVASPPTISNDERRDWIKLITTYGLYPSRAVELLSEKRVRLVVDASSTHGIPFVIFLKHLGYLTNSVAQAAAP